MTLCSSTGGSSLSDDFFVYQQLNFSLQDVKMMEFSGELAELHSELQQPLSRNLKFRIIGTELIPVRDELLPHNAHPLTRDAALFKIVSLDKS